MGRTLDSQKRITCDVTILDRKNQEAKKKGNLEVEAPKDPMMHLSELMRINSFWILFQQSSIAKLEPRNQRVLTVLKQNVPQKYVKQ